MMNETQDVESVLADFCAAAESDGRPVLAEWIRRYPAQAEELRKLAMFRDVVGLREPEMADDPAAELRFSDRASVVAKTLREGAVSELPGIVSEAKLSGLTPVSLAERIGLSVSFVARLDQRLFRPASVPASLVAKLSESLNRSFQEISTYLALPPRTAASAQYRSAQRPQVTEQIDFQEAVRGAQDLSDEQKSEWLKPS
jgi:hypothetical protein